MTENDASELLASTIISFRSGPGKLGMRSETLKSMREQASSIRRLSNRIQDITGITIPEVESALNPPK